MRSSTAKTYYKDSRRVVAFRKEMGLKPIEAAFVWCLKCDKKFFSSDKCAIRLCTSCQECVERYEG